MNFRARIHRERHAAEWRAATPDRAVADALKDLRDWVCNKDHPHEPANALAGEILTCCEALYDPEAMAKRRHDFVSEREVVELAYIGLRKMIDPAERRNGATVGRDIHPRHAETGVEFRAVVETLKDAIERDFARDVLRAEARQARGRG